MSRFVYSIIVIFLLSCTDEPAGPSDVVLTTKLYVCDQPSDKVIVYDASSNDLSIIDEISINFSDDPDDLETPHFVAVDNLNGYWFVTTMETGYVGMYSIENDSLLGTVFVDDRPALMAVDPIDQKVYVSRMMTMMMPGGESSVLNIIDYSSGIPIDGSDIELTNENYAQFPEPHAISISEDGSYLFTASITTDWFSQINLQTSTPQPQFFPFVEGDTAPIADNNDVLDPLSSTQKSGHVFFSCSGGDVVQSWDAILNSYQDTYDFMSELSMTIPWHITASPISDMIFVVLSGENPGVVGLSFDDAGLFTKEWDTTNSNFSTLHGIAVSDDGSRVYVSSRFDGKIFTLDALTGSVVGTFVSTPETQLTGIATAQVAVE